MSDLTFKIRPARNGAIAKRGRAGLAFLALIALAMALTVWAIVPLLT